jgi:tetratricopeptide (TPR) repeat protein
MNFKIYYSFLTVLILLLGIRGGQENLVLAQTEGVPQAEQINPLEIRERDLLLPSIDRPLTDFELKRLRTALDELNNQAKAQLEAGNDDEAFAIWYRELRLRRVFGTGEEIEVLTRVGAIAWDKSRNQDLNFITERLLIIEAEVKTETGIKPELLPVFAQAYETLHNLDKSLEIYQQILTLAEQKNDPKAIKNALDKIGQFYLAKFNYYQAEPIYKRLLTIAQEQQNYLDEGIYLRKLAEISTQISKPENSVIYKEQLAESYLANQQLQLLPDLKIAIADDYKALDQPEQASQNYQEAFALAWSLQQLATAGDALKKLGKLYQDYNQNDYALQIYQELIKIEQQSYNLYGLMNTYDSIGKIYLKENQYNQALAYFEKALEIAYNLKYKIDYFSGQIQQLNEAINSSNSQNSN